jgi:hypothetical protein
MKMKKIVLTMAIVMLGLTSAKAQVNLGVRGGFNITEMSFNEEVFDTSNRLGFFVGPVLKFSLPFPNLGLDIAGYYDQRDMKIDDETITQKSIIVPANLRLNIGFSDVAGIYLAAGPQISFNIGDDKYTWKDWDANKEQVDNTFRLNNSVFSVNLGGGVNLGRYEIGVNYNIGVSNTADVKSFKDVTDTAYDKRKAKTNTWQIHGTIYF